MGALIDTCEHGTLADERDCAVPLFLLDTSEVIIRYGKGGKSRTVFLGCITPRAVRAYLRVRDDRCPALFASKSGEYLT